MRIQEMRSGRAYLDKRVLQRRFQSLETRPLRPPTRSEPQEAISRVAEPEISTPAVGRPHHELSELEKPQWSVVSFSGLVAGGLTYSQATRLIDMLGENDLHGLCVITDVAALQID